MADKTIEFEGIEFSIPSDRMKLPVTAVEAWEDDKHVSFVRELMGPEAWSEFTARKPDMEAFSRLAVAIGKSYGFESTGESSASGDSSKSSSTLSRPPSPPSIESNSPVSASAP